MAIKRAEITSDVVNLIEKLVGKEKIKLKDNFNDCVNELLLKGLNSLKISSENIILLDITMQTAKKVGKVDEINEKLKEVLKELNHELIKEL